VTAELRQSHVKAVSFRFVCACRKYGSIVPISRLVFRNPRTPALSIDDFSLMRSFIPNWLARKLLFRSNTKRACLSASKSHFAGEGGEPGGWFALILMQDYFLLLFAYAVFMFQGPQSVHDFVVNCKGCRENIAAMVQTLPAQPIAVKCPLCSEHRQYLPSEVFQGRLSHLLLRTHRSSTRAGRL
jgi:hypothetical protein